jgi:hypothetical protein
MKNTLTLFFILSALSFSLHSMVDDKKNPPASETEKTLTATKCQAPKWAIAIGHEEMWKLHNGCGKEKTKDVKKQ